MKPWLPLTALAALTCGALAQTTYPLTLRHDAGSTTLKSRPTRVIAMGPHNLDVLLSLGVQPVGYASVGSGVDDWGTGARVTRVEGLSALKSAPVNVGLRQTPSLEVMLSLRPDLILTEDVRPDSVARFERIAPTLAFTGNNPDDWRRTILPVGRALGREAAALRVLAADKQLVNAARARLAPALGQRRVLMLVAPGPNATLGSSLQVRTGGDWASNIAQRLGVRLVRPPGLKLDTQGTVPVSSEVLPGLGADTIIVLVQRFRGLDNTRREWFATPVLASLAASRANRVYFVDQYLWSVIRGPSATRYVIADLERIFLTGER